MNNFDGSVPDSAIRWTDDKDGALGTGSSLTTSHLSVGVHHITASATDSTGGTGTTDPLTVTITVSPPVVRISAPATGSSFPSDQAINFRGTAFDRQDGDLAASAGWSVDGTPVGHGATLFSHRIAAEGTHTVTLSVQDAAGLSSSASITVDVGPGTGKPSVAITAPENHHAFGLGEAGTFTASGSAPGGATISNSGYRWTDSVDGDLGTGPSITKTLSGFACYDQAHHVTVTATDSYGRTASDSIKADVVQIC